MPATIEELLTWSSSANIKVPPVVPYVWNDGDHDIEKSASNVPIIGMAYAHEKKEPPKVKMQDFLDARKGATKEKPTAEEIDKFEKIQVDELVSSNFQQYLNWYLILVACTQVRELSDANLQNFAKMSGSKPLPPRVKSFLIYWAAMQEPLYKDAGVQERFADNKFFEYHTTGSSTPGLCMRALDEVEELGVFEDAEKELITAAYYTPECIEFARMIPPVTLVKARAVLEACGNLPEIWYMGEKAKANFTAKKYTALVMYLKQIFAIQVKTEDLSERSMPVLKEDLKELLTSFPINIGTKNEAVASHKAAKDRKASKQRYEDDRLIKPSGGPKSGDDTNSEPEDDFNFDDSGDSKGRDDPNFESKLV